MRRGAKKQSNLANKPYPLFYACYLLKSIKSPRSTATYIGSTPNPPRRLRQHNGEITQGAWKTRLSRPWVMQLIVFGFPSKLAALQFEWAWQHPQRSRHLRSSDGTPIISSKSKHLKNNILIVRTMVAHTPYNRWPLHVKIFTKDASKVWQDVSKAIEITLPLPLGFTISVELEGVDGKSGELGSGREGPIEVFDEAFTSAHLAKQSYLIAQSKIQICTVCREDVDLAIQDALLTCLCPITKCNAVSHMHCLEKDFLSKEELEDDDLELPRGGICQECKNYILWGDVIRGSHRRKYVGKAAMIVEEEDEPNASEDSPPENETKAEEIAETLQKRKGKAKVLPISEHGRSGRKIKVKKHSVQDVETEGEFFDLDNVSMAESLSGESNIKRRQRKQIIKQPSKPKQKMRRSKLDTAVIPARSLHTGSTPTLSGTTSTCRSYGLLHIDSEVRSPKKGRDRFKLYSSGSESSEDQPLSCRYIQAKKSSIESTKRTNSDAKVHSNSIQPLLLARAKAQSNSNKLLNEGDVEESLFYENSIRELSRGLSSLSVVSSRSNPSRTVLRSPASNAYTEDEIIIISD